MAQTHDAAACTARRTARTCWRFVGPSQRVLECGVYRVATGLEVRAGYSAEDIVRTQLMPDIGTARAFAAAWRQALIDTGRFTEVG